MKTFLREVLAAIKEGPASSLLQSEQLSTWPDPPQSIATIEVAAR